MAQKKGWVTRTSDEGWALVITERGDACHNCEAAQFCHSMVDCAKLETKVLNRAGAGVGDRVSISLSSKTVFQSAALLYLLPTAALLTGAAIGAGLSRPLGIGETGAAMVSGLAGLILGFVLTGLISRRQGAGDKLTPVITQVIRMRAQAGKTKRKETPA